jgi:exodeoxyribonuclease V gamma subunit
MHLASHLDGQAMTTQVISKNGVVPINPLEPKEAQQHFNTLIEAYLEGLRGPLGVAPKTGFAWLEKNGVPFVGSLEKCEQEAVGAAFGKYEDGYNYTGEANQSPYLQRLFPTFEMLWSNGRFTQLCHDLYAPLMRCVGKSKENT